MAEPMDVYVIPVAPDRYELYCEPAAETAEFSGERRARPRTGVISRLQDRFNQMLRAAEARQRGQEVPVENGWLGRMQERLMSWVVERIAEQRLLWNLRNQTAVVAVHPPDLPFDEVVAYIKRALQRDYDRHRNWLIVDTIGLVASAALTLLPGPNLLAYYFLFRVGGHWFSMRGASQGRYRITWSGRPCPALGELRDVANMDPEVRDERIRDVASRLRLRNLTTFFERVVIRHA
jgi:Mitochondrial K+-H+ exchange-related